jgi:indolepyruvate ferredoxin oxidoreductase beta subunit
VAASAGNPLSTNVVLLGAAYASGVLPMTFEALEEAVMGMFPQKSWESNLRALKLGAGQKWDMNDEGEGGG